MNKIKNRILAAAFAAMLMTSCLFTVTASAKTLAESFSSSVNIFCSDGNAWTGRTAWKKSCTSKTNGYNKYHYVRAYIGGTKDKPNSKTIADTGRKYSYGDVSATATTGQVWINDPLWVSLYFPTAYAKYGS